MGLMGNKIINMPQGRERKRSRELRVDRIVKQRLRVKMKNFEFKIVEQKTREQIVMSTKQKDLGGPRVLTMLVKAY
ncbi:hypothetical protein CEXT_219061 [Caerostris extrusa]|uniref:Uncharacterized protein n=1 Tax=Caerostris extrusa TaxID=172846 RepID=A0AAV4QAW0_CAEEX|nr:hypothetical protein CEXT_219061 [Caerostris extrusa]